MSYKMSRAAYAKMFGPTTGDKVRLADTELFIEVEKDFTTYGDEVKFGGGKVIRDGMGQSQVTRAEGAVDTVITNALIVDHSGIVKADIGLKNGRIVGIGKAGNPDTQPGRHNHRRSLDRGDRRRGQDRHGRRYGQPHPFHLPAADRGGADERYHDDARRRLRAGARDARHDLHRRLAHRADDRELRCLPDEPRACRQGQCVAAGRASSKWCCRAQVR